MNLQYFKQENRNAWNVSLMQKYLFVHRNIFALHPIFHNTLTLLFLTSFLPQSQWITPSSMLRCWPDGWKLSNGYLTELSWDLWWTITPRTIFILDKCQWVNWFISEKWNSYCKSAYFRFSYSHVLTPIMIHFQVRYISTDFTFV